MSDKYSRPDRAHDDDFEVPTYKPSVYERAGRAAPRNIEPAPRRGESDPTTMFPAGESTESLSDGSNVSQGSQQADTTAFPAAATQSQPGAEAATGAPYRDEDFAGAVHQGSTPATSVIPAQEPMPLVGEADPIEAEEDVRVDGRRGTIDLGLLIARLLLGLWLTLESLATFFQLGGHPGLPGLQSEFGSYPLAGELSIAVPAMQLAAGVFLVFGLITPVAAAIATVVSGFVALHELATSGVGLNIFAWPEAVWLAIVLFGLSVAFQFTGPGKYSLDFGRSWVRRPLASSWVFIVLAVAGLGVLWWFGTGINPIG